MCGICGAAGRPPELPRLRSALRALEHRGPDGAGEWTGERVMLGHRRLALLDLSARGSQPMGSEDDRVQVVLNGEIYNFAELRRALEPRHTFRSRTDTEVLVHGYEEWGMEGLLARVRGMFAFAVWDDRERVLHAARDPLGEKPLFYAADAGQLAFASTLPALLALRGRAPELSPAAVQDYLVHLCVPAGASLVEGVHKLLPGHRAEWRDGRLSISRYWELRFDRQEARGEEEWLEAVEAELRRAVRERMVADVPVGVFLSGGVDSSLVAALMADAAPGRVTTLSARFSEAGFDEGGHARRVAGHLGSDHHEYTIGPADAAHLPGLVHAAGEPLGDAAVLPLLQLSRAARERVTVVLTGDGGDESFAGYPGPMLARLAGPYRRVLPGAARAAIPDALAWLERHGGPASGAARKLRRLAVPARGEGLAWEFDALGERGFHGHMRGLFAAEYAARLAGRDPAAYWRSAFASAPATTDADRVLWTELTTLLPDQFLVKTDVATMAHGLEARSPFLDVGVVELAARIPAHVKTARMEPKRLLKRLAARHVPPDVVYRRKQGLAVPLDEWMRGSLGGAARGVLLSDDALGRGIFEPAAVRRLLDDHRAGRAEHGSRIWVLLMLELWIRMFVDRSLGRADVLEAA
jgi:asparagine synthase (glutamine-hydrolysing)